jgi:hypothetical protein
MKIILVILTLFITTSLAIPMIYEEGYLMDFFTRLHHAKGEKLFDFFNVGICCNVGKMIISPCHALMGS